MSSISASLIFFCANMSLTFCFRSHTKSYFVFEPFRKIFGKILISFFTQLWVLFVHGGVMFILRNELNIAFYEKNLPEGDAKVKVRDFLQVSSSISLFSSVKNNNFICNFYILPELWTKMFFQDTEKNSNCFCLEIILKDLK